MSLSHSDDDDLTSAPAIDSIKTEQEEEEEEEGEAEEVGEEEEEDDDEEEEEEEEEETINTRATFQCPKCLRKFKDNVSSSFTCTS